MRRWTLGYESKKRLESSVLWSIEYRVSTVLPPSFLLPYPSSSSTYTMISGTLCLLISVSSFFRKRAYSARNTLFNEIMARTPL